MADNARKIFYALLREQFAPELRSLGFKGSGGNYRRIRGEVINTINIQGNRYGGSSAVNLGLHLAFLPCCWNNEIPDVATIKEADCEFRTRLAPKWRSDYWWKYEGLLVSPRREVEHLVQTYLQIGEPAFSGYDTVDKIAGMLSVDDVLSGKFLTRFGGVTAVRGALTMARVHRYLGNTGLARDFANAGLKNLGRATALEPHFLEVLGNV